MIEIIAVLLVILWLLGYVNLPQLPFLQQTLIVINGQPITILNVLVFIFVLWAIGILPSPFREIAGVLFVLWLLSLLGIVAIAGLSNLIVIAIIIGIAASILKR